MNHVSLKKYANKDVVCSGKGMCTECRHAKKKNKGLNNKKIRQQNKKFAEEPVKCYYNYAGC